MKSPFEIMSEQILGLFTNEDIEENTPKVIEMIEVNGIWEKKS